MENFNPYAPPQVPVALPPSSDGVWRSGKSVYVLRDNDLPARCIRCNRPAHGPAKQRRYSWHTPWLLTLIVIGLLIYLIVALIVRKSFRLRHRRDQFRRNHGLAPGLFA